MDGDTKSIIAFVTFIMFIGMLLGLGLAYVLHYISSHLTLHLGWSWV